MPASPQTGAGCGRLRRIVRVGVECWPLWLTAALVVYLFRPWYFSLGYLTFGDFKTLRPETVSGIFPFITLWLPQFDLGVGTPLWAPFYSFFGWLAHLGMGYPLGERVLFFWCFPLAMPIGTYLLVHRITGSRTGSGVAALFALFNGWLLTVALGGEPNFTNASSIVPWILLATLAFVQTRRHAWLALAAVAIALEGIHDLRWVPPTVVFAGAPALGWWLLHRSRQSFAAGVAVAVALLVGIVAGNLYWVLPHLLAHGVAPAAPTDNLKAHWAVSGSVITFRDALSTWNPYFVNEWRRPPILTQHAPILGVVIPVISISAALYSRRMLALFFGLTYVIGAVMTAGANPPLGMAYVWMFVHVPLMSAYRDPGIFGFVPLVSAAVLIGIGIASAEHRWGILRAQGLALVVAAWLLTIVGHAFSPSIGGIMVDRTVPLEYRQFNDFVNRDAQFSRVLWFPEMPRWYTATDRHPGVDGLTLGRDEFSDWLSGGFSSADPLSYVSSPLFGRLLAWADIKYVAVPLDVETDATIEGGSATLAIVADELSRSTAVVWVGRIGNILVYRARETLPLVWTTNAGTLLGGGVGNLAAAAPFQDLLEDRVIVARGDNSPMSPRFDAFLIVQPGTPTTKAEPNHLWQRMDWIASANSLLQRPWLGDSTIDTAVPTDASWTTRTFMGSLTLAMNTTVSAIPWSDLKTSDKPPLGRLLRPGTQGIVFFARAASDRSSWLPSRVGRIIYRVYNMLPTPARISLNLPGQHERAELFVSGRHVGATDAAGTTRASWVAPSGVSFVEVGGAPRWTWPQNSALSIVAEDGRAPTQMQWLARPIRPMPLREHPTITIEAYVAGPQHVYALFALRDPVRGERYLMAAPFWPRTAGWDLHDLAWQKLMTSEGPLPPMAFADRYDDLVVDGVAVVSFPVVNGSPDLSPEAATLEADEPQSRYVLARFSVRRGDGKAALVADHVSRIPVDGFRFEHPTQQAGEMASPLDYERLTPWITTTIDVPLRTSHDVLGTVLLFHAAALDPGVMLAQTYRIAGGGKEGENSGFATGPPFELMTWQQAETALSDQPNAWSTVADIRLDIGDITAQLESGCRLAGLRLLVRNATAIPQAGELRLSAAYVIKGRPLSASGPIAGRVVAGFPSRAASKGGYVKTGPVAAMVPLAVDYSHGELRRAHRSSVDLAGSGTRLSVQTDRGDPWLVFSERFDPQWVLRDDRGRLVGTHVRVFGFLNAWYVPGGLRGAYTLTYRPNELVPPGEIAGGLMLLGFMLIAVHDVARSRREARVNG